MDEPVTFHASSASSSSVLDEAKENVRVLKARLAPQAEVRSAVEKYVSLKYGTPLPQQEPERKYEEARSLSSEPTPSPVVSAQPPQTVEEAADLIRALKTARASQTEVKAAVDRYIVLKNGGQSPGETSTPTTQLSLPPSIPEAAELVRSLKAKLAPQADVRAAVAHYSGLKRAASLAEAADRVRQVKQARASQGEVNAAVAAYVALLNPQAAVSSSLPSSSPTPAMAASLEQKEVAPLRNESAKQPAQVEVKASPKVVEVAVQSPEVDAAAQVVRALKAKLAPQDEVRAAVETYLALKYPSRATANAATQPTVTKSVDYVSIAADRVRTLKAAQAPQAQVTAAVEGYKSLRTAVDNVRTLKAANAPQAEVSAAVERYKAVHKELFAQQVPQSPDYLAMAADRVRTLKAAKAPRAQVVAAVEEYKSLRGAADIVRTVKAAKAPKAEVAAAVEHYKIVRRQLFGQVGSDVSSKTQGHAGTTEESTVRFHLPNSDVESQ